MDTFIIIFLLTIGSILGLLLISNLFRLEKWTTKPFSNLIRPLFLTMHNQKITMYLIKIPIVIVLGGILISLTIKGDMEAQKEKEKEAYQKEKLRNIRDLQVLYKSQNSNNKFCDNFDDLIDFAKNDSVEITQKVEKSKIIINQDWIDAGWKESDIRKEPSTYITSTGETKVNEDAGWTKKTWTETILISKKKVCCSENDSIKITNVYNIKEELPTNLFGKKVNINSDFINSMTIENLAKVPGTEKKFILNTDFIKKTKTGTFEVSHTNPNNGKVISIGDLQSGSTDGNWE